MTAKQPSIPLEELEALLHKLAGGRALVVRDSLPGDVREAVEAEGELLAYRKLLGYLEYYEECGEWPAEFEDEAWRAFAGVSRAMYEADLAAGGRDEMPKIGVQ